MTILNCLTCGGTHYGTPKSAVCPTPPELEPMDNTMTTPPDTAAAAEIDHPKAHKQATDWIAKFGSDTPVTTVDRLAQAYIDLTAQLTAANERAHRAVVEAGMMKAACEFNDRENRSVGCKLCAVEVNDDEKLFHRHDCPLSDAPLADEFMAMHKKLKDTASQATAEAAVLLEAARKVIMKLEPYNGSTEDGYFRYCMFCHDGNQESEPETHAKYCVIPAMESAAPLAAAFLADHRRLVEGQRTWQPMSAITGPHAEINMIARAAYDMNFAIITDWESPDKSALVYGHGDYQMFCVIEPPSNEAIDAIRAGVK